MGLSTVEKEIAAGGIDLIGDKALASRCSGGSASARSQRKRTGWPFELAAAVGHNSTPTADMTSDIA